MSPTTPVKRIRYIDPMRPAEPRIALTLFMLGALLASSPRVAQAQSPADKAMAETLFREGRESMEAGRIDEACAKLEGSQKIDPKIGTLTNLAACHELQGKTASAWAEFREATGLAVSSKRANIEQVARTRAGALEAKLSKLTILLSQPADGVDVAVDGKNIVAAAIGTAIPVDPGDHTVQAKVRGGALWSLRVVAAPGPSSMDVKIPSLQSTTPDIAPEITTALPIAPESPGSGRMVLSLTALGVGVVSLGIGGYFGVRTLAKKNDGDALCRGAPCTQEGYDLQQEAGRAATLSTIFLGAGIAITGAGAYVLLTAPRNHPTVRAVPLVGARDAGIRIVGAW